MSDIEVIFSDRDPSDNGFDVDSWYDAESNTFADLSEQQGQMPAPSDGIIVPPVEVTVDVNESAKRFGGFGKVRAIGVAGIALFAGVGAHSIYERLFGSEPNQGYEATVEVIEKRVFENVELELLGVDSDIHIEQTTRLDRENDFGLFTVDLNPFSYDTHLDTEVTTSSEVGINISRLEAEVDAEGATMDVVVDGEITLDQPSIDWDEDSVDIELRDGNQLGVGTGEMNKARSAAMRLIQRAGEISNSCALKMNDIKELFIRGIVTHLKTMSFSDGIAPEDITVSMPNLDLSVDAIHGRSLEELDRTINDIREESYPDSNNKFEVDTSQLTDCESHNIVIEDRTAE